MSMKRALARTSATVDSIWLALMGFVTAPSAYCIIRGVSSMLGGTHPGGHTWAITAITIMDIRVVISFATALEVSWQALRFSKKRSFARDGHALRRKRRLEIFSI